MKCVVFTGIIYSDSKKMEETKLWIDRNIGHIFHETEHIPFDFTDYYNEEMGENLKRFWIGTERIIYENELVQIKKSTIEFEKQISVEGNRKVNIDPGGIGISRVILVTTKNYSHRIYLGNGIYGEITLIYKKKKFQELPWTYPDYKTQTFIDFALKIRNHFFV